MRNVGEASLHALRTQARRRGISTNLLIARWAAERLLYRLHLSPYREILTLRGAFLFTAWEGDLLRSTLDIDLHIDICDNAAALEMITSVAALTPPIDDGVQFDTSTASSHSITQGGLPGARIALEARVGSARSRVRVDIGFGNPIHPGPELRQYPSLLPSHPSFAVRAYPRETVVGEKLAIAVEFGADNTRLRDYWDLWFIASRYRFVGHVLLAALEKTFATREAGTAIARRDGYWEAAFDPAFACSVRDYTWRSWTAEHTSAETPPLPVLVQAVQRFALPVLSALRDGEPFQACWASHEGWRPIGRAPIDVFLPD